MLVVTMPGTRDRPNVVVHSSILKRRKLAEKVEKTGLRVTYSENLLKTVKVDNAVLKNDWPNSGYPQDGKCAEVVEVHTRDDYREKGFPSFALALLIYVSSRYWKCSELVLNIWPQNEHSNVIKSVSRESNLTDLAGALPANPKFEKEISELIKGMEPKNRNNPKPALWKIFAKRRDRTSPFPSSFTLAPMYKHGEWPIQSIPILLHGIKPQGISPSI